jgi:hypothetical protein
MIDATFRLRRTYTALSEKSELVFLPKLQRPMTAREKEDVERSQQKLSKSP